MSDESSQTDLIEDAQIQAKVAEIWDKVFAASIRVLHHVKKYGFSGMEQAPTPNIYEILVNLQILSSILDILISNADRLNISYDETRQMLNAKEQATRMERLATALKANKREDFEDVVAEMDRQAHF